MGKVLIITMPSGDEFGLAVKTKSEGETRTEPRPTGPLSNAGFRPLRTPVFPGSPCRSRLLAARPDRGAQKPQGKLSRLGIGWSHSRRGGVAYVDERRAEPAGPAPPGPQCPACGHAEVPEAVPRVGEAGPRDAQGRRVRRWCEGSDRAFKVGRARGCWAVRGEQLILTWQGRYHDHEGGFPRARLIHCTPDVLTPAISPNVGNSTA